MNEVQRQTVDIQEILRLTVDSRLSGRPIELMAPIRQQFPEVLSAQAIGALPADDRIGPAGGVQAALEVDNGGRPGGVELKWSNVVHEATSSGMIVE